MRNYQTTSRAFPKIPKSSTLFSLNAWSTINWTQIPKLALHNSLIPNLPPPNTKLPFSYFSPILPNLPLFLLPHRLLPLNTGNHPLVILPPSTRPSSSLLPFFPSLPLLGLPVAQQLPSPIYLISALILIMLLVSYFVHHWRCILFFFFVLVLAINFHDYLSIVWETLWWRMMYD